MCLLAGSMGEGHIPSNGLREFARVTKSGGLVIVVMRAEYLQIVDDYKNNLEPLMQKMADERIWSLEYKITVPNYSFDKNGLIFIFRRK